LQATALAYLAANDSLTGSTYQQAVISAYDQNGDGIIDYTETGKGVSVSFLSDIQRFPALDLSELELLRIRFLLEVVPVRCLDRGWNQYGHEFDRRRDINAAVTVAMRMSREPVESADSFFPSMTWGKGKWPSVQFARHIQLCGRIYGPEFPTRFGILSLYGIAFNYADLKWNGGEYSGKSASAGDSNPVGNYHAAITRGVKLLPFVFYVPPGYGRNGDRNIPNAQETADPNLIFTASFDDGREVWRELPVIP
jgi:hypothetical protein